MAQALTSVTGDAGVYGVGLLFTTQFKWIFRPQQESDAGIDAQVEPVLGGRASGRFLGLQIKSGASWFTEPTLTGDGWYFGKTPSCTATTGLTASCLYSWCCTTPTCMSRNWQQITPHTAIITGKGFKVEVPASQRLDRAAHDVLARLAREVPPDDLSEILDELPTACANRLRMLDETDPTQARRLATILWEGRDHPAQVVQQVPRGVRTGRSLAWAALGEYANAYGLSEAAAEDFLRADQTGGGVDRPRALARFRRAVAVRERPRTGTELALRVVTVPESHLLAAVGLAALDHSANPGPIPVPPEVMANSDGAADEPTVQRFLADQRMRVGDWDAAIAHHEQALAHAPGSTEQQLALAGALMQRAGTGSALVGASDYRQAAALADAARAERRRWRGDSAAAAHVLMQARILVADDASAFRVGITHPEGRRHCRRCDVAAVGVRGRPYCLRAR